MQVLRSPAHQVADPVALVCEVMAGFRADAAAACATLALDHDPALPLCVSLDAPALARWLRSTLEAALAPAEAASICVRCQADEGGLAVEVSRDGATCASRVFGFDAVDAPAPAWLRAHSGAALVVEPLAAAARSVGAACASLGLRVRHARTLAEAAAALADPGAGLVAVVCAAALPDGAAQDLLDAARAEERHAPLPFLVTHRALGAPRLSDPRSAALAAPPSPSRLAEALHALLSARPAPPSADTGMSAELTRLSSSLEEGARGAVDPEIAELIPIYLHARAEELPSLRAMVARRDAEALRRAAHQLRGSGGGYGFPWLTELGDLMGASTKQEAWPVVSACVDLLERFVDAANAAFG